jgi:hypothetical protein
MGAVVVASIACAMLSGVFTGSIRYGLMSVAWLLMFVRWVFNRQAKND